jgi:hypothetical protein
MDASHPSATSPFPQEEAGATQPIEGEAERGRRISRFYVGIGVCTVLVIAIAVAVVALRPSSPKYAVVPRQYVRYLGVYEPDAPGSYAGVYRFAEAIGRQPNLVSYYSAWGEGFAVGFATTAARHGALTLVQIDPSNVSLAGIASGQDDAYLRSYAATVKAFGLPVILSFGHEMNGMWSPWGYEHVPPAVFVRAWRHVVNVFRAVGAENATWMWTVNIVSTTSFTPIPNPSRWWPGRSYVNWVGIDGYYYQANSSFSQVFGPTILDVRQLTGDPIIIAETGAVPAAGQAAKISDLFAGSRAYGLFGFLWYDENAQGRTWRISSPGAFAAFRRDASKFVRPPLTPTPAGTSHGSSTSP